MGELIDLEEYREKKSKSTPEDRTRRLAEIAMEKLLLQSEENQIKRMLGLGPETV